jgi:Gas vesicle protein K
VTAPRSPRRIEGSGEDVGRGLGRLVVRQVVERQALRRVEVGDLDDEQVERLGRALMQLEITFDELIEHFGVVPNDLYLPLDLTGLASVDPRPQRRAP